MEWGDLSVEDQAEVAAMDQAEFSEWRAVRAGQQAAERRRQETDAQRQLESSVPHRRVNRLALLAFGCSLLALLIWFAFGPAAIILGFKALKEIPDSERGRGLAKWAIALGTFFIVMGIVGVVILVQGRA